MADSYFVDRLGACRPNVELSLPSPNFDYPHPIAENAETATEISATLKNLFPKGLSLHGERYLLERYSYGQNAVTLSPVLELICELVRRWKFPDRPSRFQSFFTFEDLGAARAFRASHCQPYHRIYRVIQEPAFRGDMNLLKLGPTAASSFNLIQKYWNGEHSAAPNWELLLNAPVRILDQVDPALTP